MGRFYGAMRPHRDDVLEIQEAREALAEMCRRIADVVPGCRAGQGGGLIECDGFSLIANYGDQVSLANNEIVVSKMEASFDIDVSEDYKPLLIVSAIALAIENRLGSGWIEITDSQGTLIPVKSFDDLKAQFESLSLNYQEARRYAVVLGVAQEIVNFGALTSNQDDCYF